MALDEKIKVFDKGLERTTKVSRRTAEEQPQIPYALLYFETVTYEELTEVQAGPTHPFYVRK